MVSFQMSKRKLFLSSFLFHFYLLTRAISFVKEYIKRMFFNTDIPVLKRIYLFVLMQHRDENFLFHISLSKKNYQEGK